MCAALSRKRWTASEVFESSEASGERKTWGIRAERLVPHTRYQVFPRRVLSNKLASVDYLLIFAIVNS